jgi:CubicO group peptidase (beta-lactamase class C family)
LRHRCGKEIVQDMNRLTLLASALLACNAVAAPDEEALGKSEGYPVCAPSTPGETRCLVGMVSHYDELLEARKVAKGAQARPLKRAPAEPAIHYTYQKQSSGLADYLSHHRATALLILKGDTILVERYQYDRTPEQRMTSYSMAKTIVAMLVGVASADGAIQSLDDRADKYVGELKGTPYGETSIRHLLTMSSGIRFSETYGGADDLATLVRLSVLKQSDGGAATVMPFHTRERPPGERFHYS